MVVDLAGDQGGELVLLEDLVFVQNFAKDKFTFGTHLRKKQDLPDLPQTR